LKHEFVTDTVTLNKGKIDYSIILYWIFRQRYNRQRKVGVALMALDQRYIIPDCSNVNLITCYIIYHDFVACDHVILYNIIQAYY
jgi:hypothetical protein